jgi:hypothetical protein
MAWWCFQRHNKKIKKEVAQFRVRCLTNFFVAFFQMAQLLMIEGYANSDWSMFFERQSKPSAYSRRS